MPSRSAEYVDIKAAEQSVIAFSKLNGAHAFYKKDKGFRVFNVGVIGNADINYMKTQSSAQRDKVVSWMVASTNNKAIEYVGFYQQGARKKPINIDFSIKQLRDDLLISAMLVGNE